MHVQVCSAIFDQGNVLQNAGEKRHLMAAPAGEDLVCDGRVQARNSTVSEALRIMWIHGGKG